MRKTDIELEQAAILKGWRGCHAHWWNQLDECSGEVRWARIRNKRDTKGRWSEFRYCQAAFDKYAARADLEIEVMP